MDATELPMRDQLNPAKVDYAQELSNLGYPGFAHFQSGEPNRNPAQLLVKALSEHDLDRRVVEALPWLVLWLLGNGLGLGTSRGKIARFTESTWLHSCTGQKTVLHNNL
ncbi:MAG TPA: hypothetical protein VK513_13540 [Terriglobales bacterium]|nr:hypothetical protein [Terriglobales bacterium]